MFKRIILLCALMGTLSGCIVTPRIELSETIYFDAPMPNQTPMTFSDLLCCEQCTA